MKNAKCHVAFDDLSHVTKCHRAGSSKPQSSLRVGAWHWISIVVHVSQFCFSWFCLNILGPSHPQNVKVQATSSVSIRVTWDEPAFPNGIIKEYIISYGTSKDFQPYEQTVTGKTTERVLDGLDKFTTYFIKVRGKTSKMGNASKILNTTTYEDSKQCVTAFGKIVLCLLSKFFFLFRCKFSPSKLSSIISAPLSRGSSSGQHNCYCYTSHLKYVFRLEEYVSRVMGHNSLTLKGINNLNFPLARDQVVHLKPWQICVLAGVKQVMFSQFVLF